MQRPPVASGDAAVGVARGAVPNEAAGARGRFRPAPLSPWQVARELALALAIAVAYSLTRGLARASAHEALLHAQQLLAFEQSLDIDPEEIMQGLALHLHWLLQGADWFYLLAHIPILLGVAAWLLWTRPQAYVWFRNAFVLTAVIGLAVFVVLPVAPPRYLPGFTDTLKLIGVNVDGSPASPLYNPYAAMPSLHIAWATLDGVALYACARAWWLRLAGCLLPPLMVLTVLLTGNHFLLDTVAGGLLGLVALALSARWSAWAPAVVNWLRSQPWLRPWKRAWQ